MKQKVKAENSSFEDMQEIVHPVSGDKKVVAIDPKAALKNSKRSKKGRKKLVILLVLLVAAGGVGFKFYQNYQSGQAADSSSYTEYTAEVRDIKETLSGSGTLEPADSYTVSTLVTGEVLTADFEEGDIVDKDTLLYTIDSSDVATSLEKAQMSLEQNQLSYDRNVKALADLKIISTESGKITDIAVEVGDSINAGDTIATILDKDNMELTVPFSTDDAALISLGQAAAVTLTGSYETLNGTVTKIATVEDVSTGNMVVKDVVITVKNPGGISTSTTATAMVGSYACTAEGTFDYKASADVKATVSGDVAAINFEEGDTISDGDLLATLSSDSLSNAVQDAQYNIRSAQMTLDSQQEQLEDYQILSPISGTIVEKNIKKGDTLSDGVTLCTIFDLSYLTTTLSVDELDISKVSVGQTVDITVDALEGQSYEGVITKININGTTASGVTSYPVTIRIDETEGLLPGMNANLEIVVAESEGVVTVPVSAIERGNKVLVKTDADSTAAGDTTTADALPDPAQGGEVPADAAMPEASVAAADDSIPEGFEYREVTTGLSDEDYIEITEGINEGDVIAVMETVVPTSTDSMMMPGAGGGPQGAGGPPSGGGAPSGGGGF